MLLNYHIGRLVLSSLCVGDLVRLVLGGVRFAGFSFRLKPAKRRDASGPVKKSVAYENCVRGYK